MTEGKSYLAYWLAFILSPILTSGIFYSLPGDITDFFTFGFVAFFYGAPFYYILGGLAAFKAYQRGKTRPLQLAGSALVSNLWTFLIAPLVLGLFAVFTEPREIFQFALIGVFFGVFGIFFAPLWGLVFGLLYNGFIAAMKSVCPNTPPTTTARQ